MTRRTKVPALAAAAVVVLVAGGAAAARIGRSGSVAPPPGGLVAPGAVGDRPATPAPGHPVAGPEWPAAAYAHVTPAFSPDVEASLERGDTVQGEVLAEPGPVFPRTVRALVAISPWVAVVEAVDQRAYWGEPTMAYTATNYRVIRTLRGTLPAYVQTRDTGVRARAVEHWRLSPVAVNAPLPEVGRTYVLFLTDGEGGGRYGNSVTGRFDVRDGVVHSLRDAYPRADLAVAIAPTSLDAFARDVSG